MNAPRTREFKAWINLQPPGPFELIVIGEVETKSGADLPVLTEAAIDGTTLKLTLTIENTGGIGTQDINFRDARFEREATRGEFTQVDILWNGVAIEHIDVAEVH